METAISLVELNNRIASLIAGSPMTQRQWITAELSDVAVRRGHCYMELLQKDDAGQQLAKARAVMWANTYNELSHRFERATGQRFTTGLKLMLCVSANMHPVFGLSLVITDINPEFTLGDLLRRRREILERLKREGIVDLNKQLQLSDIPQNIAVISAPGAAGYGDFINQLFHNPYRLRFKTQLFEAVMQGTQAAPSIISALDRIGAEADSWDCVVIIRGGGATSDLQGFEDYDLAANICNFPLPVIVGIGHERDITLLDYVAFKRVKTPTAAAEWLIALGNAALEALRDRSQKILHLISDRIAGQKEQLSYYQGIIPLAPFNASRRGTERLNRAIMSLSAISSRRISPALSRLDVMANRVSSTATTGLARQADKLSSLSQLVDALSPQAVLNRGYSITRIDGKAVTDASTIPSGTVVETTLASGTITSKTI